VGPENPIEVQDHSLGILQLQKLGYAGERVKNLQCFVVMVVRAVVVSLALHPFDPEGRRRGVDKGVGLAGGRVNCRWLESGIGETEEWYLANR
jgi:hypothetical protein